MIPAERERHKLTAGFMRIRLRLMPAHMVTASDLTVKWNEFLTVRKASVKTTSFREFQDFTLAVARGERAVDPNEPKIWMESRDGEDGAETAVRFTSLEAGTKLLSAKNRAAGRSTSRSRDGRMAPR
jgi:hypothetical protein